MLLLHGLEGSSQSAYLQGQIRALQATGVQSVVMHFRGCSGEPNRLPRTYHSGETEDLDRVVRWLRRHWPERPRGVVGYSLGGNVLLKWLGERGYDAPVSAAVAVSVPMELAACAERMERGFSRIYLWRLVGSLRRKVLEKYARSPTPLDLDRVRHARGFREFDNLVTAPLHGFSSADDYYRRCSSRGFLAGIRRPTLIVHALDDPFMTPSVLPDASSLPRHVTLELSPHGGHVGFVEGAGPLGLRPDYWLERRVPAFIIHQLSGRAPRAISLSRC